MTTRALVPVPLPLGALEILRQVDELRQVDRAAVPDGLPAVAPPRRLP